jgi:hypothetical protein
LKRTMAAVESSLEMLRTASTDSEKIAALLLVAKVARAGEMSEVERRQIFDAVGFSFVNRLLDTEDEAGGSSDVPNQYHELAVTLLACFATDPQLATHSEVTSKVPLLLKFISCRWSQSERDGLCQDCLQLLLSLTASPKGVYLLLSNGSLQTVASQLVEREGGEGVRESLTLLLERLLGQEAVVIRYGEQVEETVGMLASGFKHRQDEVKFDLCRALCSVLETLGRVSMVCSNEHWMRDIASGLFDILSSKISAEMRASALLLAATLCSQCGADWTLVTGNSQLFRLLANLASLEMRLCLEEREGLESLQSDLLCSCCIILESSVAFTAVQTSSCSAVTEEDILQLHSAFTEAFKSTTDFLVSLPPPLPHHNPLVIAIVRVLGAWLAEETLAISSKLYKLLPKLLEMCRSHLNENKGESERCLENPLRFLLPGLSHLVAEDTARAAVKTALPQLLVDFMTALYDSSMSSEAVSSFSLCLEVLLTLCVGEPGLRSDSVSCQLSRLLSKLLLFGIDSLRLSVEAVLLWMMIAREQEMMAVVATLTDVKQLLVESHAVSRLAAVIPDLTPTHLGNEELEVIQQLSQTLC